MTEQEILDNAYKFHNIDFTGVSVSGLLALINYARAIGYNDGYMDANDDLIKMLPTVNKSQL